MPNSFSMFLDTYLDVWSDSSLTGMKNLISQEYKAREITDGNIVDFGYEVITVLPLRDDETMAILSATLVIQG